MKRLPIETEKNGFQFTQIERNDTAAIYRQHRGSIVSTVAFEVWKIRIAPEGDVFGKHYPEREVPPSNEDFGTWGWTFGTIEDARNKYQSLTHPAEAATKT